MIPLVTAAELDALAGELASVERVAVDAEGNGWHAYRARLCVLQLAWQSTRSCQLGRDLASSASESRTRALAHAPSWPRETAGLRVAIVDALAAPLERLAEVLGPRGPIKVIHDLSFDARLLCDRGLTLGRVSDTSVWAQLVGDTRLGLATLLESRLGVVLEKALQDHDWGQRPLSADELAYLAEDVRHLLPLEAMLRAEARAADVVEEVELECAHKLRAALAPAPPALAPHLRVKGWRELKPAGRRALRHLAQAREELAAAADVPAFRIARSELLLDLARRLPADQGALAALCRRRPGAEHAARWLEALTAAATDQTPDVEAPRGGGRPERNVRPLARKLSAWRQEEARARGVPLQVVLPSHCVDAVCAALTDGGDDLAGALAAVEGLGARRIARYAAVWAALLTEA